MNFKNGLTYLLIAIFVATITIPILSTKIKSKPQTLDELRTKLLELRPKEYIGSGPFKVVSITEGEILLEKFEDSPWANDIQFEKVRILSFTTNEIATGWILQDVVDISQHWIPPPAWSEIEAKPNWHFAWGSTLRGPALYFNHKIYPLSLKEVRQAIAYALDREAIIEIASPKASPTPLNIGFAESIASQWLTEETLSKLTRYDYNVEKANQILDDLGFKKGDDGIRVTPNGTKLEFEIIVVYGWSDFVLVAEQVAEQLAAIGIKATVKTIESPYFHSDQYYFGGNYQMAVWGWWPGWNPLVHYIDKVIAMEDATTFPHYMEIVEVDGKKYNITELVLKASEGFDFEKSKQYVNILARIWNEYVPYVNIIEQRFPDLVNTLRVEGWPDWNNPDEPMWYELHEYRFDEFMKYSKIRPKADTNPDKVFVFDTSFSVGGHLNPYESTGFVCGNMRNFVDSALANYINFNNTYKPDLAEKWWTEGEYLYIKIRKGAKWHDGNPVTAKDLVSTYYLLYLTNHPVWQYIDKAEEVDESTVRLHIKRPSQLLYFYALDQVRPTPYKIYGEISDAVMEVLGHKEKPVTPPGPTAEEVKALSDKVSKLEGIITQLQDKISSLEAQINTLQSKIAEIEAAKPSGMETPMLISAISLLLAIVALAVALKKRPEE